MAALGVGSFKGPCPVREPTTPGNPEVPEPAPAQHDGECAEGVIGGCYLLTSLALDTCSL